MDQAITLLQGEASSGRIDLTKLCFQKQLAFLTDPSLFATAVTSRRAGKTTACALDLLSTATGHERVTCLYITLARTNAKRIIWPMLLELNRDLGLLGQANQSDLSITFPNGSVIYVSGAATKGEIDRFRGLALKLVYVDESQSFGTYLEQLIDDVLVQALFDYKGRLRLIGTPPPVPVGYFFDAHHNNNGWTHHHWTMFENPWIEKKRGESPDKILEQELLRRGVSESDPTIQREVFGRFVVDATRLVIDYERTRNHFVDLPPGKIWHVLGIDLGFKDADALAVVGYGSHSPTTYLVDELITPKQGLTELVNQVEMLRDKYGPHKLVIDTGGLGLKIAEEMRRRYKIPVVAAEKTRKFETIELLNDALRNKRFMARNTSRFASDAGLMEWDMDKARPDKKVVSDRFHSDIIDAALYAFRESPAYTYEPPIPKPKYGTEEWAAEEAKAMEEAAEEHFRNLESPDYTQFL